MDTLNKFGFTKSSRETRKLFSKFGLNFDDYSDFLQKICAGKLAFTQNIEQEVIKRKTEVCVCFNSACNVDELFDSAKNTLLNKLISLNIQKEKIKEICIENEYLDEVNEINFSVTYDQVELEDKYNNRLNLIKKLTEQYPLILAEAKRLYDINQEDKNIKNAESIKIQKEIEELQKKLNKINSTK